MLMGMDIIKFNYIIFTGQHVLQDGELMAPYLSEETQRVDKIQVHLHINIKQKIVYVLDINETPLAVEKSECERTTISITSSTSGNWRGLNGKIQFWQFLLDILYLNHRAPKWHWMGSDTWRLWWHTSAYRFRTRCSTLEPAQKKFKHERWKNGKKFSLLLWRGHAKKSWIEPAKEANQWKMKEKWKWFYAIRNYSAIHCVIKFT